jgi:1,4-alpha-glucan branching enzyme
MDARLDTASMEALARGDHGDPFSVLGMHAQGNVIVVRTLHPGATCISVVESETGRIAPLERVHAAGLFEGIIRGRREPFRYRLRIEWENGSTEIEDPYRFPSILDEVDTHLLAEGSHPRAFEKLGAHPAELDGVQGIAFAVWAPNARRVSVIGPFNQWDGRRHPMRLHPACGVWELFIPGLGPGLPYKFEIKGPAGVPLEPKSDPYALEQELPPQTGSIIARPSLHHWRDADWMSSRQKAQERTAPISIYEVHLGSWKRKAEGGGRYLTYRELADELVPYAREMGFTHIELLPVTEHPFDGSWGYQPISLFAPTNRFGSPDDFRDFVDRCHREGLGVIMDWVPGHFPNDPHGLVYFDGTHLYEHADPRKGQHKGWNTLVYDFARNEVANYLLSNALYWIEQFHVDGLRVDAVSSMLYLDYNRREGEWIPNIHGGRENLEAIHFLRRLNELVYGRREGAVTIAEESTAWPMVSHPTSLGGLGFGYKWNMGWMHDTLRYMSTDPIQRRHHHNDLTFGLVYAFAENFVLPLSHDEVVHGKKSLLGRMPGDRWQQFANLRAYFGFMYTHPGKKLLFMGGEFAQEREWNHDQSLDWHLLSDRMHEGVRMVVRDLNRLYRTRPALHELDCEPAGFEWIDATDTEQSVISFLRRGLSPEDIVIVVCNFTPIVRYGYRLGVPNGGDYLELLNTDGLEYGGTGASNGGRLLTADVPAHGRPHSLALTLPPLSTLVLAPTGPEK